MSSYTLVSGASSGIGLSIAKRLSESYNLILLGRDTDRLEEVLAGCKNPDNHLILQADLASPEKAETVLAEFLSSRNIGIEYFVYSAGVSYLMSIKSFSYDLMSEMFNINLFSAMTLSKMLVKKSVNKVGLKSCVFVSSISSHKIDAKCGFYSASKAALEAFTKTFAVETAPLTRVNAILPGRVKTPMTMKLFEDKEEMNRHLEKVPLGLGQTTDIANAVEFLLSEKARWITGQCLRVDGGETLG